MPITLKYTDHRKVDQMIDSVFKAYANDEVSLPQGRRSRMSLRRPRTIMKRKFAVG